MIKSVMVTYCAAALACITIFSINLDGACPSYPIFAAIPGETLWSLMDQVGVAFNQPASEICIISSLNDIFGSEVEAIGSTIDEVQISVLGFESLLESLEEQLCSQVMVIQSDIAILASLLDSLDTGILSVSDVLIAALSESSVLLFSLTDEIITAVDAAESSLESLIDSYAACLNGVMLTQASFAGGTVTISESGLYTLCENIIFSGSVAIVITANDVVLDLNNYTISTDTNDVIDINFVSQVTVKNGSLVSSGQNLLSINNGSNVVIDSVTSIGTGIDISTSENISVVNCNISGTTIGLQADDITDLFVSNSAVYNTVNWGFRISGSSFVIEFCVVDTADVGIFCISNNGGFVRECYAYNLTTGYMAQNETDVIEFDHIIAENCDIGFENLGSSALLVMESSFTTSITGIQISSGQNTVIKRCSVVNNTTGISIDASSANTQIFDSCVVNNTANIIDLGIDTVVIDLMTFLEILCSKIEYLDATIETLLDNASSTLDSYLDIALSDLDALANTVECTVATEIRQADLPYTITQSGTYTVCEPLTHNGSPVITINANSVLLNLNQYTINTDNQAIVANNRSNITIKDGTIRPGQEAIVISNGHNIMLENITIYEPADVGISYTSVGGFGLTGCHIQGYNSFVTGITNPGAFYFNGCGAGIVEDCHVLGTMGIPQRGFVCTATPTANTILIRNSTVQYVAQDGFLVVESGVENSQGVIFDSCLAIETTNGFTTTNTIADVGPSFIQCVALCCAGTGFMISSATNSVLQSCIAMQNASSGFVCDSASSGIELVSCIANYNLIGFNMQGSDITGSLCTAIGNTFQGVLLSAASGDTVMHGMLLGRNGSSGFVDGGAVTPTVVDIRSQDPANAVTPNPAYILNGATDSKASSVVIRTS